MFSFKMLFQTLFHNATTHKINDQITHNESKAESPEQSVAVSAIPPLPSDAQKVKAIEKTAVFLDGLYETLIETQDNAADAFKRDAECFYQSPQSRAPGACKDFYKKQQKTQNERLISNGLRYLHTQGDQYEAAYKKEVSNSFHPHGLNAERFFFYAGLGAMCVNKLTREELDGLFGDRRNILIRESGIYSASNEIIKKYWKPVRVLSGEYGQYNTCICYDEEFDVFIELSPDDNYYHWGGYEKKVLSDSQAEKRLSPRKAELFRHIVASRPKTLSPYRNLYLSTPPPEIGARIIKAST